MRALVFSLLVFSACQCPGAPSTDAAKVAEIRASEAVVHGAASRLRVTGIARIEDSVDRPVTLPTQRAAAERWFHLVPIVDEAWSDGDPIPLWVTTPSADPDAQGWKAALAAALNRGAIDVEVVARAGRAPRDRATGWHLALEAAATDDGPISDPRAPIAVWPPS